MNLLLTGNLSAVDPYALETWGNPLVIAIDQDPLGYPAILLEDFQNSSVHKVGWLIVASPPLMQKINHESVSFEGSFV